MVIWLVSIGEVVARETFGFDLRPASPPGHDAVCTTRGNVQIKITGDKSIALRGECDHLIVLSIVSPQEAEIVYDGRGDLAWQVSGPLQKNGQRTVSLSKLVKRAGDHEQFENRRPTPSGGV